MLDHRLVRDVALAAVIVLPAALPPTATPRGADTHLVSSPPFTAYAQNSGGLYASGGTTAQRQS